MELRGVEASAVEGVAEKDTGWGTMRAKSERWLKSVPTARVAKNPAPATASNPAMAVRSARDSVPRVSMHTRSYFVNCRRVRVHPSRGRLAPLTSRPQHR